MDIPLYSFCVGIAYLKETFSNQRERCLIDRFITRIGILRGVYVLNSMSFSSSSLNNSLSVFLNAKKVSKIYDQYLGYLNLLILAA